MEKDSNQIAGDRHIANAEMIRGIELNQRSGLLMGDAESALKYSLVDDELSTIQP